MYLPFCWRKASIFSYYYFSFWSSIALILRFALLISPISLTFSIFLYLLWRYFSCSSRIAASALIFISSPSSIYSFIYWMYFFLTSLCCFLIPFSKSLSFFFYSSFFLRSYSYLSFICSFILKQKLTSVYSW